MPKRISHIGIAVTDLEAAVKIFSTLLGYGPEGYEEVAHQKVTTAIFNAGESRLELLQGTADDSPISLFVHKRGPGMHHVALQVDDIHAELARLKKAGMQLIDDTPRPGVGGTLIAFLHPRSTAGVLVELRQKA